MFKLQTCKLQEEKYMTWTQTARKPTNSWAKEKCCLSTGNMKG